MDNKIKIGIGIGALIATSTVGTIFIHNKIQEASNTCLYGPLLFPDDEDIEDREEIVNKDNFKIDEPLKGEPYGDTSVIALYGVYEQIEQEDDIEKDISKDEREQFESNDIDMTVISLYAVQQPSKIENVLPTQDEDESYLVEENEVNTND